MTSDQGTWYKLGRATERDDAVAFLTAKLVESQAVSAETYGIDRQIFRGWIRSIENGEHVGSRPDAGELNDAN